MLLFSSNFRVDKDIGHEYMSSIEERYTDAVRHVQSTPWEVINELIDGGLGKGELGVLVAPAGIGKSWALMNIGADSVKKGKVSVWAKQLPVTTVTVEVMGETKIVERSIHKDLEMVYLDHFVTEYGNLPPLNKGRK